MTARDTIEKKLTEALHPESISVVDESHLHIGHAGHRPGGETHFRIHIVSAAFEGKSPIERHRMVNALIAENFAGGRLHALALTTRAPGEEPR